MRYWGFDRQSDRPIVRQLDSPIGNINMFKSRLFSFKLTEVTLKYILYKVIHTTLPYLVSIIFIVLRKCRTIEPSDYQTVGLSMRTRCNIQQFHGKSDKNSSQ